MTEHSSPSVNARPAELTTPPAMTRHPQHDRLLILWVFNRRGSCCSLFRKPLATPQPKPSSKRLCSHRRRSQRVRIPAARLHGYHLHLMVSRRISRYSIPQFLSQAADAHRCPSSRSPSPDGPHAATAQPAPSLPHCQGSARRSVSEPSQSRQPEAGGEVSPRVGEEVTWRRRGKARGPGSRPAGGARQPRPSPPPPGACKLVAVGEPRLSAVPPAPGASARAHAQARRRQVRALSLAAGGLLRCGAAPLEPAGARFGNKQQRAVFPNPSAPAAGWGVGVCARGEARREAGCGHEFLGSSPTRCRRRPRRVCRPESSGASRRPGVSVETGGERRPHPGGTLQPGRVGGWGSVPFPPSVLSSRVGAAGLLGTRAGVVVVVGAQPGSAAGTGSGAG